MNEQSSIQSISDETLQSLATQVLVECRSRKLKLVTAESLTGGWISATLTSIAGSSDVVDRAFVTYSYDAKTQMLGVSSTLLQTHGAVHEEVARAMALGALAHSHPYGSVSVAVTGVAGPGPSDGHPAGTVFVAVAMKKNSTTHVEVEKLETAKRYPTLPLTRENVRRATILTGLTNLLDVVKV